ncbi:hypothetical protein EV06_1144 [Prochlorococcus sp. MIT 0602]|nr:hypothetical protein EV06_1144 [Prochlorococcus sp. MIT 0602]
MLLPRDLNQCESALSESIKASIRSNKYSRISVNLSFQGLRLTPLVVRLYYNLLKEDINIILAFSDIGSSALAKRDYPELINSIFTFKELLLPINTNMTNKIIIAVSPQPFEYEQFESLCTDTKLTIIMLNGRLEETAIGVGYVGRERRIGFIRSWHIAFWIEPFRLGAIYKQYNSEWNVFKYTKLGYIFCESFSQKPDNDLITNCLT